MICEKCGYKAHAKELPCLKTPEQILEEVFPKLLNAIYQQSGLNPTFIPETVLENAEFVHQRVLARDMANLARRMLKVKTVSLEFPDGLSAISILEQLR